MLFDTFPDANDGSLSASTGWPLSEDGGTLLEYAVDECTTDLLSEMTEAKPADPTAFICWYCARPFIGRASFYIHLLQETMALTGISSSAYTTSLQYKWVSLTVTPLYL